MTINIEDIAKNIEIRAKEQKRSVILGVLRSTAGIRQAMLDAFKRRNTDEVIRLASQLTMNPDVDMALALYMSCEENKDADVPEEIDFDPDEEFQLTDKGRALVKQMAKGCECRLHESGHSPDTEGKKVAMRLYRRFDGRVSNPPCSRAPDRFADPVKKKRGRPAKKSFGVFDL